MSKETLSLFLLFLVLGSMIFFEKEIEQAFYGLVAQPAFFLSRMGEEAFSFLDFFTTVNSLQAENRELRDANRHLKSEVASLLKLRGENDFLKKALDLEKGQERELVLARVISRNLSEDTLVLNTGQKAGIEQGMVLIDSADSLVGSVEKVLPRYSYVRLITSLEEVVPVYFGADEVRAEAEGQGCLSLHLTLVPSEEVVEEGMLIFTAGIRPEVPSGVLVGEVEEVLISDVKPYKEARISPNALLGELDYVFILKDY